MWDHHARMTGQLLSALEFMKCIGHVSLSVLSLCFELLFYDVNFQLFAQRFSSNGRTTENLHHKTMWKALPDLE